MIKRLNFIIPLLSVSLVLLLLQPVSIFAQEELTPGGLRQNVRNVIQERLEQRKEVRQEVRQENEERIKLAVAARWNMFDRTIKLMEAILTKLEPRINKAKESGKNVDQAVTLLADARAKLLSARTNLENIADKRNSALSKAEYLVIRDQYKAMLQDLHKVRMDIVQIIRIIKGYNAATSVSSPSATTP